MQLHSAVIQIFWNKKLYALFVRWHLNHGRVHIKQHLIENKYFFAQNQCTVSQQRAQHKSFSITRCDNASITTHRSTKVVLKLMSPGRRQNSILSETRMQNTFTPPPRQWITKMKMFSFQFVAVSFAIINQHENGSKIKAGRAAKKNKNVHNQSERIRQINA